MEITILFFAHFKDRAGTSRAQLSLPDGATVADLKPALLERFPGLEGLVERSLFSVNQEFAFDGDPLPPGAEVAVFPPVSGGTDFPQVLRVTFDPLDLNELTAAITQPTTGAVCLFTGIVRGETSRGQAHTTAALEYEAYIPMAEAKLAQVADEVRQRWPAVEGIVIVQRIGRLDPGTPTVLIACSAAHRDTGVFEAARYGIDRLKEIVPIWKKEIGPDGQRWVEGDYIPGEGDRTA
jgi:molybdopterin synthase catalytic subunit